MRRTSRRKPWSSGPGSARSASAVSRTVRKTGPRARSITATTTFTSLGTSQTIPSIRGPPVATLTRSPACVDSIDSSVPGRAGGNQPCRTDPSSSYRSHSSSRPSSSARFRAEGVAESWARCRGGVGGVHGFVGDLGGGRGPPARPSQAVVRWWRWSLRRLWVAVSSRHSDRTADLPRRRKRLAPRLDFTWPKPAPPCPGAAGTALCPGPSRAPAGRSHRGRRGDRAVVPCAGRRANAVTATPPRAGPGRELGPCLHSQAETSRRPGRRSWRAGP